MNKYMEDGNMRAISYRACEPCYNKRKHNLQLLGIFNRTYYHCYYCTKAGFEGIYIGIMKK